VGYVVCLCVVGCFEFCGLLVLCLLFGRSFAIDALFIAVYNSVALNLIVLYGVYCFVLFTFNFASCRVFLFCVFCSFWVWFVLCLFRFVSVVYCRVFIVWVYGLINLGFDFCVNLVIWWFCGFLFDLCFDNLGFDVVYYNSVPRSGLWDKFK